MMKYECPEMEFVSLLDDVIRTSELTVNPTPGSGTDIEWGELQ